MLDEISATIRSRPKIIRAAKARPILNCQQIRPGNFLHVRLHQSAACMMLYSIERFKREKKTKVIKRNIMNSCTCKRFRLPANLQ